MDVMTCVTSVHTSGVYYSLKISISRVLSPQYMRGFTVRIEKIKMIRSLFEAERWKQRAFNQHSRISLSFEVH